MSAGTTLDDYAVTNVITPLGPTSVAAPPASNWLGMAGTAMVRKYLLY